jgi:hypothetical protein
MGVFTCSKCGGNGVNDGAACPQCNGRGLWTSVNLNVQEPPQTGLLVWDDEVAPVEPGTAPATRGAYIKATWTHGAGAYARCSYCRRYSDDPRSLSQDRFPCDCGKLYGWSGSFVAPTAASTWSDAK